MEAEAGLPPLVAGSAAHTLASVSAEHCIKESALSFLALTVF